MVSPILAAGHLDHHSVIIARSWLASWNPCGVKGCFAGEGQSLFLQEQPSCSGQWIGNTGKPAPPYHCAVEIS